MSGAVAYSTISQEVVSGWNLTIGEPQSDRSSVRTFGHAGRVRAVVAEILHTRRSRPLQLIHVGARELLHRGIGAEESVDLLGRQFPLRCDQNRPAVVALTVLDLYDGGTVDVASRFAPPVLLAGPARFAWLLPSPLPGAGATATRLEPKSRLVAVTGSFLGDLDPRLVGSLPHLAGTVADSELLRSRLVGPRARPSGSVGLLIATRTAPAIEEERT